MAAAVTAPGAMGGLVAATPAGGTVAAPPSATAVVLTTATSRHSPSEPVPLRHKLVSASVGAILTSLATTPIEVVKTRMQTAGGAPPPPLGGSTSAPAAAAGGLRNAAATASPAAAVPQPLRPPPLPVHHAYAPPPSAMAVLSSLVRREGVRVLWSGLAPSLAMAVPSMALYFSVYEDLKHALEARAGWGGPVAAAAAYSPLVAGTVARAFTVAVLAPLELVRTVAMYRGGLRSEAAAAAAAASAATGPAATASAGGGSSLFGRGGITGALRAEVAAGGVTTLWRGLGPTLWRDVPFSGIYWISYERGKEAILRWLQPGAVAALPTGTHSQRSLQPHASFEHTFAATFLSGAAAGSVAAAVTTPFDVIKTRRQVRWVRAPPAAAGAGAEAAAAAAAAAAAVSAAAQAPRHTWALVRELLAAEGWGGLFAGANARVAKVAPSCAIMISSYEVGKKVMRAREGSVSGAGGGAPSVEGHAAAVQPQSRRGGGDGGCNSVECPMIATTATTTAPPPDAYWEPHDEDEAAVTPAEQ